MGNKVYDVLKWVSLILFPASATLVATLGPVWGWEVGLINAVVVSINAVGVFLGILIGVSTVQYNKDQD